jgi:hypothetical protein
MFGSFGAYSLNDYKHEIESGSRKFQSRFRLLNVRQILTVSILTFFA